MTSKPLKSNVTLFFSLFKEQHAPTKKERGREKGRCAHTWSSEILHIYITWTGEMQRIQALTPPLSIIQADYMIDILQRKGSVQSTSAKNIWTCNRITQAIWSNLLLLPSLRCQRPTESPGTQLALPRCSSGSRDPNDWGTSSTGLCRNTEVGRFHVLWKLLLPQQTQSVSFKRLRWNLKSLQHIPDAKVNNMVNNERPSFSFPAGNTAHAQLTVQVLLPLSSRVSLRCSSRTKLPLIPTFYRLLGQTLYLFIYDRRFLGNEEKQNKTRNPWNVLFSPSPLHTLTSQNFSPGTSGIHSKHQWRQHF